MAVSCCVLRSSATTPAGTDAATLAAAVYCAHEHTYGDMSFITREHDDTFDILTVRGEWVKWLIAVGAKAAKFALTIFLQNQRS